MEGKNINNRLYSLIVSMKKYSSKMDSRYVFF